MISLGQAVLGLHPEFSEYSVLCLALALCALPIVAVAIAWGYWLTLPESERRS